MFVLRARRLHRNASAAAGRADPTVASGGTVTTWTIEP